MLPCGERLDVEFLHEITCKNVGFPLGKQHQGQKQKPANQGALKQNRNDGVAHDGLFLEDVVEAQQEG